MLTKLRNALACTTLVLSTIPLTSQQASAIDIRDFSIYNSNELTIVGLYVSSQYSQYWGSNILNYALLKGESTRVNFHDDSDQCVYDVKAVYSNGTYDFGRYNLCTTYFMNYYGYGGDYTPRQ
ncbi:hypothetical protein [Nostoc sp. CMAA1605]|uniref:hypothetical protein n=1 Tax=Nostoc sp. CMAA1605 TaxID=2055159 RepID=UPI001F237614|nr:hypothetical protein [Nostoc sp. CMAA1605]MCF4967131.1 hypothetical protein [Nostoc sp. CMAA1605]